ncbi:MAG: ABC transporter substrate-binding protein, partial [Phycisphaerales bacterium]
MRLPKTIILMFLLLIAVAFGATFFPVPSDTNNSQPLRIGFSQLVGYDIAIYAQESGLFQQHGLNIELIRFDESNDVARAVLRGQLDAGFTNFGRAMLFDDGTPVHVVLATDISHGGDGIVARAGIQSVHDLVGKRIGCKRRAVNQIILAEALQAHGYSLADVEQVDVT